MGDAQSRRFLVAAGNTREMIDRVRDWGNIFTGNTGYSIAKALAAIGSVDLLTSNQEHLNQIASLPAGSSIHGFAFRSHADLMAALEARMALTKYDGIFMTAAVADYTPAGAYEVISQEPMRDPGQQRWIVRDVQAGKVKSTHAAIAILGKPTRKIVDCFRDLWGHRGLLVKFKLEVGITADELITIGQKSRRASNADYLVANTLDMVEGDRAGAFLLSDAGQEWIPRGQLAGKLVEVTQAFLARTKADSD